MEDIFCKRQHTHPWHHLLIAFILIESPSYALSKELKKRKVGGRRKSEVFIRTYIGLVTDNACLFRMKYIGTDEYSDHHHCCF